MMVIHSLFSQMRDLLVASREFDVPPAWAKRRESMIVSLEAWFSLDKK